MDRQQISDSIFAGSTTVPRSVLVPNLFDRESLERSSLWNVSK